MEPRSRPAPPHEPAGPDFPTRSVHPSDQSPVPAGPDGPGDDLDRFLEEVLAEAEEYASRDYPYLLGRGSRLSADERSAAATRLAELAREQRAGRLRLRLSAVTSISEMLTPADREAIGAAFGVPVTDMFVSTEGLVGHTEPGGPVFTFASDTCLAECVDEAGRPVPDGTPSARVLVTNLHNLTQPLIRYELTDRLTPAGTSPGGFLRASVEGRQEDVFCYGAARVHPSALTTVLLRAAQVREYQVRQTARGAAITVVADPGLDEAALAAAVEERLREAGVTEPRVTVAQAEMIARDGQTGKVRRFIAASPGGPAAGDGHG